MPNEALPEPDAPRQAERDEARSDADYDAFYALMRQTARGRALLDEYARRHRAADTQALLAALARIERLVSATAPPQADPAAAIAAPPPEIKTASPPEPSPALATVATTPPAREPVAAIMAEVGALSEEERIALFT